MSGTVADLSETDLLETDLEQTDTVLAVSELLMDFADDCNEYLGQEVALKLAERASLEQVEGWLDYIDHKGDSLTSPLGFLISKLRKGDLPPDPGAYRELTFREAAACFEICAMRDWQRRILELRGPAPETVDRLLDLWTGVLNSLRS